LDEPTAVLTPQETSELFDQLRRLRAEGCAVVIITHKLREIFALCDRVTILRAGRNAGVRSISATNENELMRLMIGRDVRFAVGQSPSKPGGKALEIRHITVRGVGGKPKVNDVSFTLKQGEILCLAGVEGNGQRETARCVTGAVRRYSGSVALGGQDIRGASVRKIRALGLAHIPEDRLTSGVNLQASITDNLIALRYERESRLGYMPPKKLVRRADSQMRAFHIKADSCRQRISMLSGGNMQKVVVAREMDVRPAVLVADQPTRGVDIGAMEFIHQKLLTLRDEGGAVLLISADLAEVMALSDRILVFHEGRINAEITHVNTLTEEQLGRYMLGIDRMETSTYEEA
jgi:simple sugar transport system ATP-binding protein